MSEMFKSKLFRAAVWILLVFLIILVGTQIFFVFVPLVIIFQTLFFPFLIAGFLYFLTNPFVDWLERKRIPRGLSILLIYLAFFGIIALLAVITGPILQREFTRLLNDAPEILNEFQKILVSLQDHPLIVRLMEEDPGQIENIAQWLTDSLNHLFVLVVNSTFSVFEFAADLLLSIVIIPFILFYMLRDGRQWPQVFYRYLPEDHAEDIKTTMEKIGSAISSYIQGLFVVCICVGVLVYIGYQIIGLNYPLLLASFAMFTNVIPFVGPIIGTVPGIIVAIIHSPLMIFKVLVVVVVVQQVESLLISPQVMGKKLAVGPLSIILVILVAGSMAGLLGMILALPTFVILRIITNHIYNLAKSTKKA
ncbi:AI-2E family transporter [Candidatus Contubernalis alkaliaceticus]|uniref:AI-2E family transporter n=1 Tax=Candidatus Contubernalis alkaliaceticus TaxID=338645 RepID=UPI001F4C06F7|nr:AI-2E family transporter [Candidatus Contubernalis alkalaceticus]UNC91014.1 AI-2E family transporter [Candidatus Contubernalis alkalaceticus]